MLRLDLGRLSGRRGLYDRMTHDRFVPKQPG
ncbi:Hypothetical Protein sle_40560 [Streptomyces leeuwenhoekii]|uniref:Uncharacterized protein n=1 Tax=Streptomyces leeuwenhoekii TaxID=1437453 RepID=A0A0F7VUX4_STRLW|nr:Hypothetical Protein sle_40560 [Streptomyces leeuwenhoekii]